MICVLGGGATLLALQATIGLLVAKTLSTATVNPFMASGSQTWNPVLAFDVFNVQASARQDSWNTSDASIHPLLSRVGAGNRCTHSRRVPTARASAPPDLPDYVSGPGCFLPQRPSLGLFGQTSHVWDSLSGHALCAPCACVQATTNMLMSHFFGLMTALWLLRIIANRPSVSRGQGAGGAGLGAGLELPWPLRTERPLAYCTAPHGSSARRQAGQMAVQLVVGTDRAGRPAVVCVDWRTAPRLSS